MGYFPNGTAGDIYQFNYCNKCIHQNPCCAVWQAHMFHNYKECNNKDSILNFFIPRSEDGLGNEQCRMFIQKP